MKKLTNHEQMVDDYRKAFALAKDQESRNKISLEIARLIIQLPEDKKWRVK